MPNVGDLITLKVDKVIKTGAFLSSKGDRNDYFLHKKEMGGRRIEAGEAIECRIVGTRNHRGRTSYQVSLRMLDEASYERFKAEQFNKQVKNFLEESGMKHSQIRKNKEKKYNNGKRKTKNPKNNK